MTPMLAAVPWELWPWVLGGGASNWRAMNPGDSDAKAVLVSTLNVLVVCGLSSP